MHTTGMGCEVDRLIFVCVCESATGIGVLLFSQEYHLVSLFLYNLRLQLRVPVGEGGHQVTLTILKSTKALFGLVHFLVLPCMCVHVCRWFGGIKHSFLLILPPQGKP